jgi:hypothetical protein
MSACESRGTAFSRPGGCSAAPTSAHRTTRGTASSYVFSSSVMRLFRPRREPWVTRNLPVELACSDSVGAWIALRDQERLPRIDTSLFDDELKLLADAREQLIVEAGRWRNRAHALLRVAAPGYQARTGALASAGAVRRAQAVARRAQRSDPVRGRLALEALARLTALERDAGKLEREIS